MLSNLARYGREMATKGRITDSPQQNVVTLFPIQTLYSASLRLITVQFTVRTLTDIPCETIRLLVVTVNQLTRCTAQQALL